MKLIKLLVAFGATVVFFVLLAQSDADYMGWMKAAVAAKGKVAKGIAAKDGPGVATDAKSMHPLHSNEARWCVREGYSFKARSYPPPH